MAARRGLKVAFVGGGSYRLLPILRGAFAHKRTFDGGEVRLVDLNLPRAEAVGRMIQRTPEIAPLDCKVTWSGDLDRALEGADALYVTMAVGDPLSWALSEQASMKRGFLSSDQLSVTGAFLGLTAGPVILDFARRMEKRCPDAMMLIFANPVAVYSGMVNNHTSIRALGLCGGFGNHRWDLSRLMGHDEYRDIYDVDVAGINHLSFILRGTVRGRDLYKELGRHLAGGWKPIPVGLQYPHLAKEIAVSMRKLAYMYQRFGRIIFSTEGDGMMHLFYEEMFERSLRRFVPRTKAQMRASARKARLRRAEADRLFAGHLDRDLDDAFWSVPNWKSPWFGRNDRDIAVFIFKALAGMGREKIAASAPGRGAVAGFKDRTVLEYSMHVDRRGYRPAGRFEVPDCFHGLIGALATHQTLVGDAIATRDPRILADALFAYPIKQNTRDSRALFKEMLAIHKNNIPAEFQKASNYF